MLLIRRKCGWNIWNDFSFLIYALCRTQPEEVLSPLCSLSPDHTYIQSHTCMLMNPFGWCWQVEGKVAPGEQTEILQNFLYGQTPWISLFLFPSRLSKNSVLSLAHVLYLMLQPMKNMNACKIHTLESVWPPILLLIGDIWKNTVMSCCSNYH